MQIEWDLGFLKKYVTLKSPSALCARVCVRARVVWEGLLWDVASTFE